MTNAEATEHMKKILPEHYEVNEREYGVSCKSPFGINEDTYSNYWDSIMKSVRFAFADRLMEVYHHGCTDHSWFTVFLRKQNS